MKHHYTVGVFALALLAGSPCTLARTLIQYEIATNKGCKVIDFADTSKPDSKKWSKAKWTGGCKSGYANGSGILTVETSEGSHETYKGTVINGRLDGEVVTDTERADGAKGSGRVTFSNGMPNGQGEMSFSTLNGDKLTYSGQFKDGLPHGTGKLTSPIDTISGEFAEGKLVGVVTITTSDGRTIYTGETKDLKPHGTGKLTGPTMNVSGQFANGKPFGSVTMSPTSGDWTYEGKINEQGKFDGRGLVVFRNGTRLTSNFDNGRADRMVRIEYPNGAVYEGEVVNFKPEGHGRETSKSGNWYEGSFRNGRPDGDGVISNAQGRFDVTIVDGKPTLRTGTTTTQSRSPSENSGFEALGNFLEGLANGYLAVQRANQQQIGASSGSGPGGQGITCFKKNEWTSGFNKNCVYNCLGSDAVQTIRNTDLCPLTITR